MMIMLFLEKIRMWTIYNSGLVSVGARAPKLLRKKIISTQTLEENVISDKIWGGLRLKKINLTLLLERRTTSNAEAFFSTGAMGTLAPTISKTGLFGTIYYLQHPYVLTHS